MSILSQSKACRPSLADEVTTGPFPEERETWLGPAVAIARPPNLTQQANHNVMSPLKPKPSESIFMCTAEMHQWPVLIQRSPETW